MATVDLLQNLLRGVGEAGTGALEGEFQRRRLAREDRIEDEDRARQARMDALRRALLESQVEAARTPEAPTLSRFEHGGQQYAFNPQTGRAEPVEGLPRVTDEPDTFTVAGREFPNTPEGQQAALDWRRQLAAAGRAPEAPQMQAPDVTRAKGLRSEFQSNPIVKDSADVAQSYQRVVQSAREPSAAGDMAMIFNFMKVLDPGSVVRESEFRAAGATGSLPARVQAAFNQVQRGERLSAEQRADFVDRARRLASGQRQLLQSQIQRFSRFAEQTGVDPSNVVFDPFAGILDTDSEAPAGGPTIENLEGNVPPDSLPGQFSPPKNPFRR